MPETPYTETEYLLAIMNADIERAREILADMSDNEAYDLVQQLHAAMTFIVDTRMT